MKGCGTRCIKAGLSWLPSVSIRDNARWLDGLGCCAGRAARGAVGREHDAGAPSRQPARSSAQQAAAPLGVLLVLAVLAVVILLCSTAAACLVTRRWRHWHSRSSRAPDCGPAAWQHGGGAISGQTLRSPFLLSSSFSSFLSSSSSLSDLLSSSSPCLPESLDSPPSQSAHSHCGKAGRAATHDGQPRLPLTAARMCSVAPDGCKSSPPAEPRCPCGPSCSQ